MQPFSHAPLCLSQLITPYLFARVFSQSAALTLGTDYVLDATTSVKAKVEVPSALVSVALEHRLKSPSVLLGLAAAYNPLNFQKQVKAEQFGVTLQFGDY